MQKEEEEQIKNVFYSFISKMNDWERFCNVIDQDKTLSFEMRFEKQKSQLVDIFNEYCTKKERKFGKPTTISYGNEGSYEYDPDLEKISLIEESDRKDKAVIFTETAGTLPSKYQYTIKKINNHWYIDSKKRYSNWKKKWIDHSL